MYREMDVEHRQMDRIYPQYDCGDDIVQDLKRPRGIDFSVMSPVSLSYFYGGRRIFLTVVTEDRIFLRISR
jgi:hypothetical protein